MSTSLTRDLVHSDSVRLLGVLACDRRRGKIPAVQICGFCVHCEGVAALQRRLSRCIERGGTSKEKVGQTRPQE